MDALSALEALCDYALYKSTFTLHYTYSVFVTAFCIFSIYFYNADDYPNDMCLFTRFTSDSYVR